MTVTDHEMAYWLGWLLIGWLVLLGVAFTLGAIWRALSPVITAWLWWRARPWK